MSLVQVVLDADAPRLASLAPSASPDDRRSALMAALTAHNREAVTILLAHACALDKVVQNDFPLAAAVRTGDLELVRALVEAGASVDTQCAIWWERQNAEGSERCGDGVSAVLEAIRYDHVDVLAHLIDAGAALNTMTRRFRFPLDFALERQACVALLRRAGAREVRMEDYSLTEAAQQGLIPRLRQLLDASPEALQRALNNAALNRHPEAVRFLSEQGVQIRGCGVLDSLARYLHLPTLMALLEAGADPSRWSLDNGQLPLGCAAEAGKLEAIQPLLDFGAQVDAADRKGLTALHFALAGRHFDVAEALVAAGADPLAADAVLRFTLAKLDPAGRERAWEVLAPVLTDEARATLAAPIPAGTKDPTQPYVTGDIQAIRAKAEAEVILAHLVREGRADGATVAYLVSAGADVTLKDDDGQWLTDARGWTLLHTAARDGKASVVAKCLAAGMPVTLRDPLGLTPLHLATSAEVVDRLVEAGADVNAADDAGTRPLHLCGDPAAVRRLLALGADPLLRDEGDEYPWLRHITDFSVDVVRAYAEAGVDLRLTQTGQSALHLAALGGHAAVIRVLLDAGVDPLLLNADGERAATLARRWNKLDALDVLMDAGGDPDAANFVLALDPKRETIARLVATLTPTPLRPETLAALRSSDSLGGLLADAIEGGAMTPYIDAVRERWSPFSELAPAFVDYAHATLRCETLGDGPWEMWGIARAHLVARGIGKRLDVDVLGEMPGVCVGRAGDASFWMMARRGVAQARGGWLLTQDARVAQLQAHALLSELDPIAPRGRPLVEALVRDTSFLDIVDLLTLFRVYRSGEQDAERTLEAALRWDSERLRDAREAGALRFLSRASGPRRRTLLTPRSAPCLVSEEPQEVSTASAPAPIPAPPTLQEEEQWDDEPPTQLTAAVPSRLLDEDHPRQAPAVHTPYEPPRSGGSRGPSMVALTLPLDGDFDVACMQRILAVVAPVLGGASAPVPLPGPPPPTERTPAGEWSWGDGRTTQRTKIWAGASSGPPGDFPWIQEHTLEAPDGRARIRCETWMLQQSSIEVHFHDVSPTAFVAAHQQVLRTCAAQVQPPAYPFGPTRVAEALHAAGRTDLARPYAELALAAARASTQPGHRPPTSTYDIALACGLEVPEAQVVVASPVRSGPLTEVEAFVLNARGDLRALEERVQEGLTGEQVGWLLNAACRTPDRGAFIARLLEGTVAEATLVAAVRAAISAGKAEYVAALFDAGALAPAQREAKHLWALAKRGDDPALLAALAPLGPAAPAPKKGFQHLSVPGFVTPSREIAPPDAAAERRLAERSREAAERDVTEALAHPLAVDALVATLQQIHSTAYRPQDHVPLTELGFDWRGLTQRLQALQGAGVGYTGALPIQLDVGAAREPLALERLLEAMRQDLEQLRALAPTAYPWSHQVPARLNCVVPDGTSHFELAEAHDVYLIHLQDCAGFVHEELPAISAHKKVRGLWLFGNQLSDDALAVVDFSPLSALQVLDLSENALTAAPPSLVACERLEWLSLANNPKLAALPDLSALERLRHLDLRRTAVSNAALAALRAQLPGCFVLA